MSSFVGQAHRGKSVLQSWNVCPGITIDDPAHGNILFQQKTVHASMDDTSRPNAAVLGSPSSCFTPDLMERPEVFLSTFQALQGAMPDNYCPIDEYLLPFSPLKDGASCELLFAELPLLPALAQPDFKVSMDQQARHSMNTSNSGLNTEKCKSHLEQNRRRPMKKGSLSYREVHIHSERQRRRGMSSLFTTLQSLLPAAHAKSDRCTTLAYVIEYVQQLKETLQHLGQKRAELVALAARQEATRKVNSDARASFFAMDSIYHNLTQWPSLPGRLNLLSTPPDVTVRFWSSVDICITLNCAKKRGLWPELLSILENQNVDVENVTVSTTADCCFHCIYGKVPDVCEVSCEGLRAMLIQFVVAHLGVNCFG